MDFILEFLVNNYIWFLIITIILLFALVGYLVDMKKDERFTQKIEIDKEVESRLEVAAAANITLNQMVQKKDDDIGSQTSAVNEVQQAPVNQNSSLENMYDIPTEVVDKKN